MLFLRIAKLCFDMYDLQDLAKSGGFDFYAVPSTSTSPTYPTAVKWTCFTDQQSHVKRPLQTP